VKKNSAESRWLSRGDQFKMIEEALREKTRDWIGVKLSIIYYTFETATSVTPF